MDSDPGAMRNSSSVARDVMRAETEALEVRANSSVPVAWRFVTRTTSWLSRGANDTVMPPVERAIGGPDAESVVGALAAGGDAPPSVRTIQSRTGAARAAVAMSNTVAAATNGYAIHRPIARVPARATIGFRRNDATGGVGIVR